MSLSEAFIIKPPKKEAKHKLDDADLVSFVPMNDLGETEKYFQPKEEKSLDDVVGSYTYFADNDVLLAKITPCFENGKLGIARGLTNGIGFGSSEYIVFRQTGKVLPEYLYYYLAQSSFRDDGQRVMSGAVGHKRVPKEFIENYQIPVPPLEEQQRIVVILDEAFAGIATATANAEKNLQNARELFESTLQSVFAEKGEGWMEKKLAEISGFQGGSQPPKSQFVSEPKDGYVRLLQIRDYKSDKKAVYVQESSKNRLCSENDIMIGRYGASVGQIHRGKAGAYNVALIKTIPDESVITRDFFYFYLRSDVFQKALMAVADRSAQAGFSKADISDFDVPVPPLNQQNLIVSRINDLEVYVTKLTDIYQQKLNELVELKQSILQKAFAGELH